MNPTKADRGEASYRGCAFLTQILALTLVLTANLFPGLAFAQAENGNDWVGKRVITKPGAVLRVNKDGVDTKKIENNSRSGERNHFRIYRVERTDGHWLRIQDEKSETAGWITAEWLIPYDQAIDYFTNEIRANPKNASASIYRGIISLDKREYDSALTDFSEAIRINPNSESAWHGRGYAWAEKHEYDKAIADFSEAIQINPNSKTAWNCRGYAWAEKKDYDKAISDFNHAIKLDPKLALAYCGRGIAWGSKQDYDRAISDYNHAIKLDPKLALAYCGRGNAWAERQDYDKAISDYNHAIKLDPRNSPAYHRRGYAWAEKHEYDKAISDYDEAIKLDPKDAIAYFNRGYAWSAKKDYDKAINDYDEAIKLDPKYVYPRYNRTVLAWLTGREADTLGGVKEVIEIGGWRGDLASYAALLGHIAARRMNKADEARKFLDDFKAKGDTTAWPYPIVRYLLGEIDEKALLDESTDDDKRTESHCYLGLDLSLKGKAEEAMTHFRWVKEHGNRGYTEYRLSLTELERLEKTKSKGSKP